MKEIINKIEKSVMEKATREPTFVEEIAAIPGGEGILVCMQCGTCTASCPNADLMDHAPSELIAMVKADMKKEVLSSNAKPEVLLIPIGCHGYPLRLIDLFKLHRYCFTIYNQCNKVSSRLS